MKNEHLVGVYCIIGPNNKRYIGSSFYIQERWSHHLSLLGMNKHSSIHLQRAWNKYGAKAFRFEVLEVVENPTKKQLLKREQYWINKFKTFGAKYGYNILKIAGSTKGFHHTLKTRKKISKAGKGRKLSPEHILKLKSRDISYLWSPENIEKANIKRRKNKPSKRIIKKRADACRLAYETGEAIPFWQGKSFLPEHKAKISRAMKGKPKSKEHRKRLSLARKRYFKRLKNKNI